MIPQLVSAASPEASSLIKMIATILDLPVSSTTNSSLSANVKIMNITIFTWIAKIEHYIEYLVKLVCSLFDSEKIQEHRIQ